MLGDESPIKVWGVSFGDFKVFQGFRAQVPFFYRSDQKRSLSPETIKPKPPKPVP